MLTKGEIRFFEIYFGTLVCIGLAISIFFAVFVLQDAARKTIFAGIVEKVEITQQRDPKTFPVNPREIERWRDTERYITITLSPQGGEKIHLKLVGDKDKTEFIVGKKYKISKHPDPERLAFSKEMVE